MARLKERYIKLGMDEAQHKPKLGEVKVNRGHLAGLSGGGGLAALLEACTDSQSTEWVFSTVVLVCSLPLAS